MHNIYRSKTDRKIAGVCGGLAQKLNIDSTIIRLIWVIASIILGVGTLGLIIYIVCALVIPEEPDFIDVEGRYVNDNKTDSNNNQNTQNNTYNGSNSANYKQGSYSKSGSYDTNNQTENK